MPLLAPPTSQESEELYRQTSPRNKMLSEKKCRDEYVQSKRNSFKTGEPENSGLSRMQLEAEALSMRPSGNYR